MVGDQKTLWVDFFLPQQQGNISINTPVSINARGLLTTPLNGKVIASEQTVSTTSRNLKLRAAIENTDATLKPGMLVDVTLITAAEHDVIAVPVTAIQYDSSGTFVYLITPAENDKLRAEIRKVTIGTEKNRHVIIAKGLQAGEKIAANGAYKLSDKLLVNVK